MGSKKGLSNKTQHFFVKWVICSLLSRVDSSPDVSLIFGLIDCWGWERGSAEKTVNMSDYRIPPEALNCGRFLEGLQFMVQRAVECEIKCRLHTTNCSTHEFYRFCQPVESRTCSNDAYKAVIWNCWKSLRTFCKDR